MTTDRCPTCDKPRAGDVAVSHANGCSCPDCLSVCWRDWGVLCEPADWRARAIAAEALVASYESPTCDHRHQCRCGSGGHPRRCMRHPKAFDAHCAELNVIAQEQNKLEDAEADAERWRKVAPLIEAMREAAKVAHHDYATEDDATVDFRVTGHELIDAVTNLLAATKEP